MEAKMNKEKLDLLLTNGAITQEEYNEALSKLQGNESETQEKGQEETKEQSSSFDEEKIEKLVQAKVDRITSKLGKEKADLQKELDKLKREKLSSEEIKQLEIKEKEKALAEKEKSLLEKENRIYAIEAIKKADLDDGSTLSLEVVDLVLAENEEKIDARIKTLGSLVNKLADAKVEKKFKTNGRIPNSGSNNNNVNNPFSKQTFNLTQQMRILKENPELAKQLQATAN